METVGDIGSLEWMVPSFLDARGRLCKRTATWLPGKVVTWIAPMAAPTDWLNDFAAGGGPAQGVFSLVTDPSPADRLLAASRILEEYDFNAFDQESMLVQDREHDFVIERSDVFGGFLLWVEVWCGAEDQPSVSALRPGSTSWQPIYVAMPQRRVQKGDMLRCRTLVQPARDEGPSVLLELSGASGLGPTARAELTCEASTVWGSSDGL